MSVAGVEVRATRMTYVGESGWELTVPVADAPAVYEALSTAGAVDAGYNALESLRLEKGYRAFGRELTPDYTPVEAGLVFATALKGEKDFLGRAALEAHRGVLAEGGPRRRLVSFVLEDAEPMLWGGELLLRDGASRRAGHERRLGGHGRCRGRVGLSACRRSGHPGLPGRLLVRGRRRRHPGRGPGDAHGAPGGRGHSPRMTSWVSGSWSERSAPSWVSGSWSERSAPSWADPEPVQRREVTLATIRAASVPPRVPSVMSASVSS